MDINNLEIKKIALHQIDVRNELPEHIVIDKEKESVKDYIENLIKEIIQSPNKRTYRFKSGNTQVKSSIKSIIDEEGELDEIIFENAKRLLEKEKIRSADMARKNLGVELQRGSLLHVHFISDDSERVLICKVESDEFLDDTNFELNRGLNTKKKVFKSFLLIVGTQTIFVNDKNNSKYWWDEFLELEFEIGDDKNTIYSLGKIIGIVDNVRLKQEFGFDGTLLRNGLLGYYRKNEVFNFSDLINEVFDSYEPYNPDFPKEKIKERVKR